MKALLVVSCVSGHGQAQVPLTTRLNTQQNPRGLRWHRIDTPHFTVVYPDSLEAEAQRAATLLERYYEPLGHSLNARPRRIPVVLNNQSLTSNGFVAWAPRRSQWYAMPPTTVDAFGPMDWYQLLAVHEGRHIVQETALRTGWVGLGARVFGDYTMALLGGSLYFPSWFWEGDAVGMETALTSVGRGRQPVFTARMRTLLADRQPYGYYQAWLGTYRTAYPDWYELGYVLTSYVRRHHGDSAWRRITRRASWNPMPPLALGMAIKRETGMGLSALHRAAVNELDSLWRDQRRHVQATPGTQRSPADPGYHAWSLPQYAGDGSIVALYSDLQTVNQLVRLREGRREVLVDRMGAVGDLQFHVRGDQVVWAEYAVDPRYAERNYLILKRLDLTTGKVTRLTSRSRYFGPALSPDGAHVAAVEFTPSRRSRLVLLSATSGQLRQTVADDSGFLTTPVWSPEGDAIYVVRVDPERGNALVRHGLDGTTRTIVDYGFDAISRPQIAGGRIYFGSPRSGLDAVWSVDTSGRDLRMVTSRLFGAYHPAVSGDGSRLLFADLTPEGYDVVEQELTEPPQVAGEAHRVLFADSAVAQEERLAGVARDVPGAWPVRPFTGWARAFDFHSLSLAPTGDDINQGLVLESRNLLNTLGVHAGLVYNRNEQRLAFEAGGSYAGLPVILDAGVRLGSRGSTFADTAGTTQRYSWSERSAQLVARLPLTRVSGLRRQSLVLGVGAAVTSIADQPVQFRFENNNGHLAALTYSASASHVRAAAFRDLFQAGVSASAVYRHTPGSADYSSHVLAGRASVIAPGLAAHHAVVVEAGHEEQRPGNYRFSSEVPFARGFPRRYHDRLTRVALAYHAPLLYPDLALGPLAYVRRVQGAVFGDLAQGSDAARNRMASYRSVGGELTADIAPFSTRTTIRTGIRVSRRLSGDRQVVTDAILALPF